MTAHADADYVDLSARVERLERRADTTDARMSAMEASNVEQMALLRDLLASNRRIEALLQRENSHG